MDGSSALPLLFLGRRLGKTASGRGDSVKARKNRIKPIRRVKNYHSQDMGDSDPHLHSCDDCLAGGRENAAGVARERQTPSSEFPSSEQDIHSRRPNIRQIILRTQLVSSRRRVDRNGYFPDDAAFPRTHPVLYLPSASRVLVQQYKCPHVTRRTQSKSAVLAIILDRNGVDHRLHPVAVDSGLHLPEPARPRD